MKTLSTWVKRTAHFLGVILLLYILFFRIDLRKLFEVLSSANLVQIMFSVVLTFAILLIMVIRWRYILSSMGIKYGFGRALSSLTKGALLGAVTPGKLGELLRAKYLVGDTGASAGKSIFSVVIDRIYDLFVLVLIAGTSIIILTRTYAVEIPLYAVAILSSLFIASMFFLLSKRFVGFFLVPAFNHFVPVKHQESAHFHFREFYDGLWSIRKMTHMACGVLSLLIWLLKFLMLYLLSLAIGIEIPFWLLLSIGSTAVIISLIPISIAGLGTREAVFIFFLSFHKASAEFALALSFLFLVLPLLSVLFLYGIVFILEMIASAQRTENA